MPFEPQATNIYSEFIIPTIQSCGEDDELLLISPSTFFGYYSLGAHNFEKVCESLKEAYDKGAKIRLIVKIYEQFSAQAGKALLKILKDRKEIRDCPDNNEIYFIARINNKDKLKSCYYKFDSQGIEPITLKYLNRNIKYLPFKSIRERKDHQNPFTSVDDVVSVETEFNYFWKKSRRIGNKVRKYNVYYHKKKLLIIEIIVGYCIVLSAGIVLGVIAVLHSSNIPLSQVPFAKRFFFPLILGILAGLISSFLFGRIKDKIVQRLSQD